MFRSAFFLILLALTALSCRSGKEDYKVEQSTGSLIPYTIKATLVHDEEAYTQGLVFYEDKVLESTGMENSWIAEVDLRNGEQQKKVVLDKKYFGEGITVLNNKVYQLTWKHKLGFIYDAKSFENKGSFTYDFEGWGLTTDGTHLIISDGTDRIYYLDTLDFKVVKTLLIRDHDKRVDNINELEFVNGYIYANLWETNYIVKIDPVFSRVVGKIDLSPIANEIKRNYPKANVLNGVAYNPATRDFLVTGKRWPRAYLLSINQ